MISGLSITEWLQSHKTLVADGAAGTMLIAAGLPGGTPPELWNVERPEEITRLHKAYLDAGSQIILTNTFGANRIKLSRGGYESLVEALNRTGVELARNAAGEKAFVAGDMGPTGELMEPMGSLTFDAAVDAYCEQAALLASAGVDVIWVETMTDLEEARAAVTAARQATHLPVFCTLSFGRKGKTMMGVTPKRAVETLWSLGLTAIGANCGEGLEMIDAVIDEFRAILPDAALIIKPNAGLPRLVDGETVYDTPPSQFAARMSGFINKGANIIGACCGSSPAYINEIAALD